MRFKKITITMITLLMMFFIPVNVSANSVIPTDADVKRVFTTQDDQYQPIEQRGDIKSYAQTGGLNMSYMGTNRQPTGIQALSGEKIKVYVEADQGAKLPKLTFVQTDVYWYDMWDVHTDAYTRQLKLGVNEFVVPKVSRKENDGGYPADYKFGALINIDNPYTKHQQNGNVKIYIEGGNTFPVYRRGQDEAQFKQELTDFYNSMKASPDKYLDAVELYGDHFYGTVSASKSYDYYVTQNKSPKANIERWEKDIRDLLVFDGLEFDQSKDNYDQRNQYVNMNIKRSLPYAAAYAFHEHIGIFNDTEDRVINNDSGIYWLSSHELGHCIDNGNRIVSETTNNMISMYNNAKHDIYDRDNLDKNFNNKFGMSFAQAMQDNTHNQYWDKEKSYLMWWMIETVEPGYWGRMDHLYRKGNDKETLNRTELHIYYSSLATKIDLSDYFSRWGFHFDNEPAFNKETMSETLKQKLQQAKDNQDIIYDAKKIWYGENDLYEENGKMNYQPIYNSSTVIEGGTFKQTPQGIEITLPNENKKKHWGYEIYKNGQLLTFVKNGRNEPYTYIDRSRSTNDTYEIVGFDTHMNETKRIPLINLDLKFKVTYQFVGKDGLSLPDEINALLPAQSEVNTQTEFNVEMPEKTEIETDDGTWTFVGYDHDTFKVTEDTVIKGTWSFKKKDVVTPQVQIETHQPSQGSEVKPTMNTSQSVETGDSSYLMVWIVMIVASLFGLLYLKRIRHN